MANVEDRVVQMRFDNAAFERKVAGTIASLDKLQASLQLTEATKGMESIGKASRNFNLGGMAASIEGVSAKFLALSTIGITVLANITNRAVDAGIRIAKALSFDQVLAGFQEYELNMNSIQTILANTKRDGTNLQDVNNALDELNAYADLTIYNFAQMTRNIGTFTAAGVDLDTSVQAIKGIANLAAISGSNSQQASTAMYQLSQAISTGTLRLQDWNSVVNAGMGGEVFQRALFETGKALGTLEGVSLDETFDEWTSGGNSFRSSLEKNWLTAEVLTTTLQGFTGEMTEAQLTAIGYTKEQAAEILELGETGVEAATKVRTLTQLIDTVKEAIGSGWSQSFRIIFGDFEEATELFSGISDALGDMVGASSDARNELLQGWKDLGGRTLLIESFKTALENLGAIFTPIREAFRDVFPPLTSERLLTLTQQFAFFTQRLAPTEQTVENIKRTFTGFFNTLVIGWEIVKQGIGFIKDLFRQFSGAGSGGFLKFTATVGDFMTNLKENLVDNGGIADFFEFLTDVIRDPLPYLEQLRDVVIDFYNDLRNFSFDDLDFEAPDFLAGALERLSSRIEGLKEIGRTIKKIWEPIGDALRRVGDVLNEVWIVIRDWFKNLGSEMAAASEPGDFDAVLDVINVGILGGIAALLAKFAKQGFSFGDGFFSGITEALEGLTGVLKAMQADIRANAILKIAGAIAVLTASVVVLAMIDSAALTKSLTAMSVGFAQLIAAFAVITKLNLGPTSAASFSILATGMIALASAMLILSFAVKVLSTLNWEELGKGLTGLAGLLTMLVVTSKLLQGSSASMVAAGVGMIAIGIALNILALAVRQFATMEWEQIGRGLAGVAGTLVAVAVAMRLMPVNLPVTASGLILVGVALNILALAVRQFATFDWADLGKGLAGVAGALVAIAIGMQLMPATLPITAVGLTLVATSLLLIAQAVKQFSGMSWEELGRGLAGLGGSLLILAVGVNLMSSAIPGAIALGIVSVALMGLSKVMQELARMSVGDIVKSIGAMAGVIIALGLTAGLISPLIPALFGLGAALLFLGAGFALFGVGANLTARAFKVLAEAGGTGVTVLMDLIDQFIDRLPMLIRALGIAAAELALVFLEAAPVLIEQLGVVLEQLLVTIADLAPQLGETLTVLILEGIKVIRETGPEWIATGLFLLMELLRGIRDNIGEITQIVIDIIVTFIDTVADNLGDIVDSGADLIIEWIKGLGSAAGDIIAAGAQAVVDFLEGVASNILMVIDAGFQILIDFLNGLAESIRQHRGELADAGFNILDAVFGGILERAVAVIDWFTSLGGNILGWIGNLVATLTRPGRELIQGLWDGIWGRMQNIIDWFKYLGSTIVGWIGSLFETLGATGRNLIRGVWNGITDIVNGTLIPWFTGLLRTIAGWIGSGFTTLGYIGRNLIRGLWNGILSMKDWIINKARSILGWITNPLEAVFSMFSPSRVMMKYGEYIGEGLGIGIEDSYKYVRDSTLSLAEAVNDGLDGVDASGIQNTLNNLYFAIDQFDFGNLNPEITPVVNLDQVIDGSEQMKKIVAASDAVITAAVQPATSYVRAADIASTEIDDGVAVDEQSGPTSVNFYQTNNSPESLNEATIYRRTRNQLAFAREELDL